MRWPAAAARRAGRTPLPAEISALINVGAVGVVLAWMLWMNNPRLDRIEAAIERTSKEHTAALERNTRALMIAVINEDQASPVIKREARRLYAEAGGSLQARADDGE